MPQVNLKCSHLFARVSLSLLFSKFLIRPFTPNVIYPRVASASRELVSNADSQVRLPRHTESRVGILTRSSNGLFKNIQVRDSLQHHIPSQFRSFVKCCLTVELLYALKIIIPLIFLRSIYSIIPLSLHHINIYYLGPER